MWKYTFCNILALLSSAQCLRKKFQDFNQESLSILSIHPILGALHSGLKGANPSAKTQIQLGAFKGRHDKEQCLTAAATPPPTARVCSGAEKPPRWRSAPPVTQFYCSSNMAVGAGSDWEVSWPHTHLLLITMPTQCLCAPQVRAVLGFHSRALNVTRHPYYEAFFIAFKLTGSSKNIWHILSTKKNNPMVIVQCYLHTYSYTPILLSIK